MTQLGHQRHFPAAIELFLGRGRPGLFPGRKNFVCVTFFQGFLGSHDGLNLGFKLSVRRTPTRKRRPDRHAHIIKLPASAGCRHNRCSTQDSKSTSTQDDVPSGFRRQVRTFRLKTGKHKSQPSSESLSCLVFSWFSAQRLPPWLLPHDPPGRIVVVCILFSCHRHHVASLNPPAFGSAPW